MPKLHSGTICRKFASHHKDGGHKGDKKIPKMTAVYNQKSSHIIRDPFRAEENNARRINGFVRRTQRPGKR
jgi:hypothetical protein